MPRMLSEVVYSSSHWPFSRSLASGLAVGLDRSNALQVRPCSSGFGGTHHPHCPRHPAESAATPLRALLHRDPQGRLLGRPPLATPLPRPHPGPHARTDTPPAQRSLLRFAAPLCAPRQLIHPLLVLWCGHKSALQRLDRLQQLRQRR